METNYISLHSMQWKDNTMGVKFWCISDWFRRLVVISYKFHHNVELFKCSLQGQCTYSLTFIVELFTIFEVNHNVVLLLKVVDIIEPMAPLYSQAHSSQTRSNNHEQILCYQLVIYTLEFDHHNQNTRVHHCNNVEANIQSQGRSIDQWINDHWLVGFQNYIVRR